jgi:predicted esterase
VFVGRNIRPFFGLQEQYKKDAIYVAPDGIDRGWPNVNGRDVRFMRDMVAKLKQELCIDSGHVYATGHSYGGMMSYAIGCEMGDVFRAVAPMSGGLRTPQTNQDVPSCAPSKNKVAAIMFHGRDDGIVPISWGYQAREMYLQKNSCKRTTVPVGKNGCVMYTGCSDAVVWCEYNGAYKGDHNPTGFSAQETRIFFDAIN